MNKQHVFPSNEEISCIPNSQIYRRVDTIPLPKELKSNFLDLIVRWSKGSGIPWTVSRLKELKNCIAQSFAHNGEIRYKPEWFKTTPSGNLKGAPGALLRHAMTSEKNLKSVLMLCNIYSVWKRKAVNVELEEEIVNSIQSSPVPAYCRDYGQRNRNTLCPRINVALRKLGLSSKLVVDNPVPILQSLPGKASHVLRIPDDFLDIKNSKYWTSFGGLVRDAFGAEPVAIDMSPPLDEVGSIHITHEPGLKTRYFASPNVILQRALEPLKDALYRVVKNLPWDCTINQRKADDMIQDKLRAGKTVYSVDLSKATDHFPWAIQRTVLSSLRRSNSVRTKNSVRLFSAIVSDGNWEAPLPSYLRVEWDEGLPLESKPSTYTRETVRWTKGQPLGLGPSFFLFTISHGIVLYILNGYRWDSDFWVLGDDVVIFSEQLHSKYRAWLGENEIEVSEAKSFASSSFAQFAGVSFTPNRKFWLPKWQELTRETLLDAQAWWYPGLLKGYKDEELILQILALPEPYGLGWNPNGIPLDARLSQETVNNIVEAESERKSRPRPRSTEISVSKLTNALAHHGKDIDSYVYFLRNLDPLEPVRYRESTRLFRNPDHLHLYDGTDLGGFPYLRFSERRKDPYSLGRISSWKRLLSVTSREPGE